MNVNELCFDDLGDYERIYNCSIQLQGFPTKSTQFPDYPMKSTDIQQDSVRVPSAASMICVSVSLTLASTRTAGIKWIQSLIQHGRYVVSQPDNTPRGQIQPH